MFLILALLLISILIGLRATRFGPLEEVVLLGSIAAAVAIQYFILGPS